ncbi:MAG: hypothetical protein KDD66_03230 [Bdellovibrionales bacterium]|nr:hypothetical protein [Bdellovibrionales bacterium]
MYRPLGHLALVLSVIVLVYALMVFSSVLFVIFVQTDKGFLLQNAKILSETGHLYHPASALYNPLVLSFFSFLISHFGVASSVFEVSILLATSLSALIVSWLTFVQTRSTALAFFGAALFFLVSAHYAGAQVIIEPFQVTVLLLLCSLLFWQVNRGGVQFFYPYAGILLGVLFFQKQSGVFTCLAFGCWLLLEKRISARIILQLLVAFMGVPILYFAFSAETFARWYQSAVLNMSAFVSLNEFTQPLSALPPRIKESFVDSPWLGFFSLLLLVEGLAAARKKLSERESYDSFIFFLSLVFVFNLYPILRYAFGHYFLQSASILVLYALPALWHLGRRLPKFQSLIYLSSALSFSILLPQSYMGFEYWLGNPGGIVSYRELQEQRAKVIRCYAEPKSNRVWILRNAMLYALSDTYSPSGTYSNELVSLEGMKESIGDIDVAVLSQIEEQFREPYKSFLTEQNFVTVYNPVDAKNFDASSGKRLGSRLYEDRWTEVLVRNPATYHSRRCEE